MHSPSLFTSLSNKKFYYRPRNRLLLPNQFMARAVAVFLQLQDIDTRSKSRQTNFGLTRSGDFREHTSSRHVEHANRCTCGNTAHHATFCKRVRINSHPGRPVLLPRPKHNWSLRRSSHLDAWYGNTRLPRTKRLYPLRST